MKAIEQYFHVVMFIMLYKVALMKSMKSMKSFEQYFHEIPFMKLCKVVLTVDETLVCDHSNESY